MMNKSTIHVCILPKTTVRSYPRVPMPVYYHGTIREDSRLGYALLARMLSEYMRTSYEAANLQTYPEGKPYHIDDEYSFSLSYSKDYIACALGQSELGIDIEQPREYLDKLSAKILSASEIGQDINTLDAWVTKEAYGKLLGCGLRLSFPSVTASSLRGRHPNKIFTTDKYSCVLFYSDEHSEIITHEGA